MRGVARYGHRVKLAVHVRALQTFGRPCVLLDTDSFIREGFDSKVSDALAAGAAMNEFVRADPYPGFGPFETNLPNLGRYVLDPKESLMYNSGLTAARPEHAPLIEDAIVLIDRLWSAGLKRHDLDQFAVSTGLSVPRAPEKWTRDVAAARPGASRLKAVQALDGCFTAISRCSRTMPARGRRAPRRRAARPTSREVRRRRTQARAQRPAGADAAWLKLGLSGFE